ncbi:hypothetical protein BDN71DRAFT_1439034, partial [Pleurotus eryngii]
MTTQLSATVGAPLVKELKVGVSTPESWNDFKLPLLGLCLYAHHNLTNHHPCLPRELNQTRPNPNCINRLLVCTQPTPRLSSVSILLAVYKCRFTHT